MMEEFTIAVIEIKSCAYLEISNASDSVMRNLIEDIHAKFDYMNSALRFCYDSFFILSKKADESNLRDIYSFVCNYHNEIYLCPAMGLYQFSYQK